MKISCSRDELVAKLGVVSRAVSTRGTVQVLGGILLSVDGDTTAVGARRAELARRDRARKGAGTPAEAVIQPDAVQVDTEGVLRFLVLAVLVASALYGVREAGVLDRAGLLGSCETVETARSDEGEWLACRGGRLSGAPDLARDSCRKGATREGVTYWYCPEKLVADGRGEESGAP